MLSRDELELRMLNYMSEAVQKTFTELRTMDDETLFSFVSEIEEKTIVLIIDAIRFEVVYDNTDDAIIVDGKEEIA